MAEHVSGMLRIISLFLRAYVVYFLKQKDYLYSEYRRICRVLCVLSNVNPIKCILNIKYDIL